MNYRCCDIPVDISFSMERYVTVIKEYVGEENITVVAVLSAVIAVLFCLMIWKLLSLQRVKRRGILLVGLSNAGKTYLMSKILTGKHIKTLTSLRENLGTYTTENGTLNLIDVPGQEAIRQKFFDQYKNTAKGVVFLIDSDSFSKEMKDVAEYLFTVLIDSEVQKIHPAVLIACNKQDMLTSKSKKLIQSQLEKEINTLRKTRSAALSTIDGEENTVYLGTKGKDFEFSQLGKLKIEFAECNAKAESEDESSMEELLSWINSLA